MVNSLSVVCSEANSFTIYCTCCYCSHLVDDEDKTKEYNVSYEGSDQLRPKVMEPDEGKPPELPAIEEYSAEEERKNIRRYRTVTVGDVSVQIDMQAVEPYKKFIQHMGESCDPFVSHVTFSSCIMN